MIKSNKRKQAKQQLSKVNKQLRQAQKKQKQLISKLNPYGLPKPNTRFQEVLRYMLDVKTPVSYYDIADEFKNINGHKARKYWQQQGVNFKKMVIEFRNRFNRPSEFVKFQIINRRQAITIYKNDCAKN